MKDEPTITNEELEKASKLSRNIMELVIDYIASGQENPALAVLAISMVQRRLFEASLFMVADDPSRVELMKKAILRDLANIASEVTALDVKMSPEERAEIRAEGQKIINEKGWNPPEPITQVDKKPKIM